MISENVEEYAAANSSAEPELLKQINRETHLRTVNPRMLSGHVQGRFLSVLSKMIQPESILEIGTFTGYSALCLAEGLRDSGTLITIESNPEFAEIARGNFAKSPLGNKIRLVEGNALDIIPRLKEVFDVVFIDGDKEQYAGFYRLCLPLLKPGALMLADNTLWGGKVLIPAEHSDRETRSLQDFNRMVAVDMSVEKVLLPMRDGITMIRKLS